MTTLKLRLFGAAATLALLSACSGSSDPQRTTAPETTIEQTATPSAEKTAALPGKLGLLNQALAKVTLRPEQKTEIDKMVSEAAVRHQAVATARTALKNAVATQLESGAFNRAALSNEVARSNRRSTRPPRRIAPRSCACTGSSTRLSETNWSTRSRSCAIREVRARLWQTWRARQVLQGA